MIELARKRGFEVIERRIMPDELTGVLRMLHHRHRRRKSPRCPRSRDWNFNPGGITKQLMDDYTAEVKPQGKAAAA